MPLAPRYTWSESDDAVVVRVQGVAIKDQTQLVCGDAVVKVSAAPYLLLLDLRGEVDPAASRATVQGAALTLTLRKATPGLWGQLTATGDKAELKARREASLRRAQEAAAAAAELAAKRRQQEERDATERRIALDRERHDAVEARRRQELSDERRGLQQWQSRLPAGSGGVPAAAAAAGRDASGAEAADCGGDESDYEEGDGEEGQEAAGAESDGAAAGASAAAGVDGPEGAALPAPDHPDYHGRGWWPSRGRQQRGGADAAAPGGSSGEDGGGSSSESEGDGRAAPGASTAGGGEGGEPQSGTSEAAKGADCWGAGPDSGGAEDATAPVPAPRRRALAPVKVTFTPLETPHLPAREAREEQLRLRRRGGGGGGGGGGAGDSAELADRQPAFLKDKGDALFKQGNYAGAVQAYSRALQLDPPDLAPLLANRAACHLKLGAAPAAAADCGAALELVRARMARLEEAGALAAAAHTAGTDAAGAAAAPGARGEAGGQQGAPAAAAGPAAAEAEAAGGAAVPEGEALRRLLVKLLARRAAAAAALRDLPAAEADLAEALRYDAGNERLEADLAEVRAAAAEAADEGAGAAAGEGADEGAGGAGGRDARRAAALRVRAEARFGARDFLGAAEAFGALLDLSSFHGNDAEAARALANRAACWLPLERYADCLRDCRSALDALQPLISGSGDGGGSNVTTDDGAGGGDGAGSAEAGLVTAAERAAEAASAATQAGAAHPGEGGPRAHAAAAARVAARAALASGCLKRRGDAARLYAAARRLHLAAGDGERAAALAADEARLLGGPEAAGG
ncbi:hypothetical protein Rsub_08343 [Raphidocelis subcapitata]|uniref:CS domain-containing protein n=1 Tax=Raphidocelis subcapitata TaxID=307507 RepID=A0A2V0P8P3_9CHLO|nr:hypothetical protein Rsub_08343 [Raphidocelis subcapitata]|eukprot:GBF95312.1 hypothetical protein Rsub_08343 [Raphidocelis subcapitata]